MFRLLHHITRAGAELLFPPSCARCEAELVDEQAGFCDDCLDALFETELASCRRCGGPTPTEMAGADVCAHCRGQPFRFASVVALGVHRDALREAVLLAKRPHQAPLTAALGRVLADRLAERWTHGGPDLLTSVPMPWWRRVRRGVNGPEILLDVIARRLSLPADPRVLRYRRRTKTQHELSPNERRRNMRNALVVARRVEVGGAHVGLIDDILTTGATADEAARALLDAGAGRVSVAVISRGVGRKMKR